MAVIEKKAAQSPASLFAWEQAVIEDRRRRRRMGRNIASAADLDESELE
jgi:hypothetical protein